MTIQKGSMQRYLTLTFILIIGTSTSYAHESKLPSSFEHFPLDQVSKHIYVVHGIQQLPSLKSRGFMNNPSAIVTQNGFIIVDHGSSKEIGKHLLKKLRGVSDKPVIAVFNTHVHGDHWLGNHGIREVYPKVPIYAHIRMIERVNAGVGQDWIKLFMGMTKGVIDGTKVVGPNIGLKGGEKLVLDGVTLKIYHTGHAHTDHDLMIEVVDDKVLFFGDIVASQRVPNSDVPQDASFKGTISAIKTMLNLPIDIYIPGHGQSGGREVPESSLSFLEDLYSSVTQYFKDNLESYEMNRVINFVYQKVESDYF